MNEPKRSLPGRLYRKIIGEAKDYQSSAAFHSLTLAAFLAWVGLGADGLSSSTYGPEKAFEALGEYEFLIVPLAIAMIVTIFTITATYCQVVNLFPSGGGGYMVASRLLGPKSGLVSGMALLVDYVLTISISCAHAADAVLSFLPQGLYEYKIPAVVLFILGLILVNLRGVKESILILMPIFLVFLISHLFGIGWVFVTGAGEVGSLVVNDTKEIFHHGSEHGWMSLVIPLIAAYAIGAGTYTGIEAVSNSMQILKEPKSRTARRTMIMMAISLAVMSVGLLLCYQLVGIREDVSANMAAGVQKTYNAVLFESVSRDWMFGDSFVYVALISEALLLFVAAQAGFIGGPRMLATMAPDQWVPRWFSRLSDRLVVENGVWFMGIGAIFFVLVTQADVTTLIIMYSINVFLAFFFSQWGMTVHWWRSRGARWKRRISVTLLGTLITVVILVIMCYKNFDRGAWITAVVTGAAIGLAVLIRRHYRGVAKTIEGLDYITELSIGKEAAPETVDHQEPTAILFVNAYNGMGLHALLRIFRQFPGYYQNFVFLSVSVFDFDNLEMAARMETVQADKKRELQKYVEFVNSYGYHGEVRLDAGLDSVACLEKLCLETSRIYPRSMAFGGHLVFNNDSLWTRMLHRNALTDLQRRLHRSGVSVMALPIRLAD